MPAARSAASPTRSRPAVAASPEDLGASVLALVTAVEQLPEGAPAAGAYRSALRRKGEALAAGGGPAALGDVLARVRASAPALADAREAILDTAWAGVLGWPMRATA